MEDTPLLKSAYDLGIKAVPNFIFLKEERISYYEKNLNMIPIALIRGFCSSRDVLLPLKKELTGTWVTRAYNLGLKVVPNFKVLPVEVVSYYEEHLGEIPSAIFRGFSAEPEETFPDWFKALEESAKSLGKVRLISLPSVEVCDTPNFDRVFEKNFLYSGYGCRDIMNQISTENGKENFYSKPVLGNKKNRDFVLLNWKEDKGDIAIANEWAIKNGLARSTACEVFAAAGQLIDLHHRMGLTQAVVLQTKACEGKWHKYYCCWVIFEGPFGNKGKVVPYSQPQYYDEQLFYLYRKVN